MFSLRNLLVLGILCVVFSSAQTPRNVPIKAAIQFGVDANLSVSPVVYGTQYWPQLVAITQAEITALQAKAEAWFAERYGVTFPVGQAPKVNVTTGFSITPLAVAAPYSVFSIRDSTGAFRQVNDLDPTSQIPVVLIEFVVSPPTPVSSNFSNYGGTYAAACTTPYDLQVRPGDNFAYGFYNFTQKASFFEELFHEAPYVTQIVHHRTFIPTRAVNLLPNVAYSVENFELCSSLWGAGQTVLQVEYPFSLPNYVYFAHNMHFPGPLGYGAIPPWTDC